MCQGDGVIEPMVSAHATSTESVRELLAADVGGTHARLALVRAEPANGLPVQLLSSHTYTCADWSSLDAILADFVARHAAGSAIRRAVVATPGYIHGDVIVNQNLPWPVSISALRQGLLLEQLEVINDFEALAYVTPFLARRDSVAIIESTGMHATAINPAGAVVVVGPGTGLGCAVLLPGDRSRRVLSTEAGHIVLAPGTERELAVVARMASGRSYVPTGHALSGPGLLNIYRALAELDHQPVRCHTPAQVSTAAVAANDPLAVESLQIFCGLLGSLVGDLAILFSATGGVYLAGGILSRFQEFLLDSSFRERFFNKGVMRDLLEQVPVRLLQHGQLGVVGAAVWLTHEWQ
jgi:glucokinase